MALMDIFNAVVAQVQTQLATSAPPMVFGPAGKMVKTAAPQIAWVLGSERYAATNPSDAYHRTGKSGVPRSVRTRWTTIDAHVWGTSNLFGPVTLQGAGAGKIAPSGAWSTTGYGGGLSIQVKMIAGGAVGTATFQYSLDGGATWSSTTTTAASVALGATGISLGFTGSFVAGDVYSFDAFVGPLSDYSSTEYLANQFLYALHVVLRGSYNLLEGVWAGQDGSEMMQQGKLYVVRFEVAQPVIEVPPALPTITSITQDTGMSFADGQTVHANYGP